ncbi:hypothetical protein, partial [Salmonella enterica]|uniref:hypothetical protein n=1 Tax=Salmonella enterica TaxID=28901 RepID=UPI0020C4B6F1
NHENKKKKAQQTKKNPHKQKTPKPQQNIFQQKHQEKPNHATPPHQKIKKRKQKNANNINIRHNLNK